MISGILDVGGKRLIERVFCYIFAYRRIDGRLCRGGEHATLQLRGAYPIFASRIERARCRLNSLLVLASIAFCIIFDIQNR